MRVYLRAIKTGTYFKSKDLWMSATKDALDFEDRDRAIRIATELRLEHVEIVIVNDDGTIAFTARLPSEASN
jgi:asparagine synthetase B (glutamine-hydrolysing)